MKNIIYIILTLSLLIAKQNSFNGNFSIARIQYGGGGDWYANSSSIYNLLEYIRNNTSIITKNEEFDAYDLVLNYLLETNQVDTIEEANYVMTQMDESTIQGIINEYA